MSTKKSAWNEDMGLAVGAKNLHEGRRSMYEDVERYKSTFLDPATGMLRAELLEARVCPVCSSDSPRHMFVKRGGTYVMCGSCRMCYLNPAFTDGALEQFYINNNTAQAEAVAKESEFFRRIFGKGLATIERFTEKGRILDVGCSGGFFLDLAREAGWNTYGVEPNKVESEQARQRGHSVQACILEEATFDVKLDAVTLWDVFEHLKDGSALLQRVRKLLSPRGLLFMQTPNVESLAARVMHERCNVFDGIEHVNLYAPSTMRGIAERNGFELTHLETVISEIPVTQNYLSYEDPYFGSAPHDGKVLGFIDEETVHSKLLGYKLQVVLRPKG